MFAQSRNWSSPTRRPIRKAKPEVESLEARDVPSVVSSISADFNGTKIPAGDTIWFNAAVTASGLPKSAQATVHVENGAIDFTAGGVAYHVPVPNGVIVFTPGATSAATTYDPSDNDWDVSAPSSGAGDVFMGGATLPVSTALAGGIKGVTWKADFWSDSPGITVNWKWAAAVFKPGFSIDYNALNVKPVDNNNLSTYKNGDQSGTPEAYKFTVVPGGTGGGGSNFTGNYSKAIAVKPTVGDGMSDYPFPSSNPLTSVAFNESAVLRAANLDLDNGNFEVWYNDEHALALGVNQVNVKTASGTTTTNYLVSALNSNPGAALNPAIGTTATSGDQAGTDLSGRPMAPSLYITDITNDPNSRSGDWQYGGTAHAPSAVFGTWKPFTRTVDYSTSTPTITVTPPIDPSKNSWSLGAGADPAPSVLTNEGYGAEIRWSLSDLQNQGLLTPGHTYRFYVIVHDGDQNKVGGDAGQASFTYFYPGVVSSQPAAISGYVSSNKDTIVQPQGSVYLLLTGTSNDGQTISLSTSTDVNGLYSFASVPAGAYTITETPPDLTNIGFTFLRATGTPGSINGGDGTGTGGTNAQITSITLVGGDMGTDYDFVNLYTGMG